MPPPSHGRRDRRVGRIRLIAALILAAGAILVEVGAVAPSAASPAWLFRPKPPLPVVRGRPESCLGCHVDVGGMEAAHAPKVIGCAACHRGDPSSRTAAGAHKDLIRIPGNLDNALQTCGQTGCHDTIIPRIGRSVMTTMAGVVAVDRIAFGEPPSGHPHVLDTGASAADSHLRQLCASCHLGAPKESWGPVTESSRGGGCNACHLGYTAEAARQLAAYTAAGASATRVLPSVHPTLTVNVDGTHCFGCHSRSSRISTNYEGWHERGDAPTGPAAPTPTRQLEDGRTFVRATADVHYERGLDCIDCHPANEVMGKGAVVTGKSDQVAVRCEDCHAPDVSRWALPPDPESQLLLGLRQWTPPAAPARILTTGGGDPLVGVTLDGAGHVAQRLKLRGSVLTVAPLSSACRRKAHARLTCSACHTAWAPRCISCHTAFDPAADGYDHLDGGTVRGAWQETAGPFEAMPPTLGVREDARGTPPLGRVIDTFVPGMILELDRNRDPSWPPDPVNRRWYARIAAHTTRREVRSCVSCHSDPVALGYGEGRLRFTVTGRGGAWTFTPARESLPDGLPADAWVGFLQTRATGATARGDARPFTVEEQVRILRVGACLTCHDGASAVMTAALDDFDGVRQRRTPACIEPLAAPEDRSAVGR